MSQATPVASGLDGVVVAETRLSDVDGERGRLVVAGHDIEALSGTLPFESMCALLWNDHLPSEEEAVRMRAELGTARRWAFEHVDRLQGALSARDGMDALRGAIAQITASELDHARDSIRLAGAIAVFAAAWLRRQAGAPPVHPDPSMDHAADYLRMALGEKVSPACAAALDAYLVTVADHGMNASTFAARLVASTGSDTVSAVVAALGALKGPLHGGAPGPVLDMLDAIGTPELAERWLQGELEAGRRIMGMGHRIYRVRDPRAAVLERAVEKLSKAGAGSKRLPLARAVERAAEGLLRQRYPDRPLRANVEFYTAVLLDAVGLPREAFTPTFAVGRVAGWCAHIAEQKKTGRLIRPSSRYVGDMPAQAALPATA